MKILTYCDKTAAWALSNADQVPVVAIVTNIVTIALKALQSVGEFFKLKLEGETANFLREKSYYECIAKMNPCRSYSIKNRPMIDPTQQTIENNIIEETKPSNQNVELDVDKIIAERPHNIVEDQWNQLPKEKKVEQHNYIYENLFKPLLEKGNKDDIVNALVKCDKAGVVMMPFRDSKNIDKFESKIYEEITAKYKEDDEFLKKALLACNQTITTVTSPSRMQFLLVKIFIPSYLENDNKRTDRIKDILLATLKMYQHQQCCFLRNFIACLNDKQSFDFILALSDLHCEWDDPEKPLDFIKDEKLNTFYTNISNSGTMLIEGDFYNNIVDESQNKNNLLGIFHLVQTYGGENVFGCKSGLENILIAYEKYKKLATKNVLPLFHFYQKLQTKRGDKAQKVYTDVEKRTDGKVIMLPKFIIKKISNLILIEQNAKN